MDLSSNFVLYTAGDGKVKLEVYLQEETLWLSQKMMAELFEVDVRTINEHLQTIYKTGEFMDLCRGPHVDNTSEIQADSFKLNRTSGVYWRGKEEVVADEKGLQR